MKNPDIIDLRDPGDKPPQELDISSYESVVNWYKSLGPDYDMSEIDPMVRLDAIASGVLHLLDTELPTTREDRIKDALLQTTSPAGLGARLADAGAPALAISDMVLEINESQTDIPKGIMKKLLPLGISVAQNVRDNPLNKPGDRLDANARSANLALALLRLRLQFNDIDEAEYSDLFIRSVRGEAAWVAQNIKVKPKNEVQENEDDGAGCGALFEYLVNSLANYQAWAAEQEAVLTVRHATLREDKPLQANLGGRGHKYAHDVSISGGGRKTMIQCKQGSAAYESRKYDPKVKVIVETSDQDVLSYKSDFLDAFKAVANSDNTGSADFVDSLVTRYDLRRLIDEAAHQSDSLPSRFGGVAIGGAESI